MVASASNGFDGAKASAASAVSMELSVLAHMWSFWLPKPLWQEVRP